MSAAENLNSAISFKLTVVSGPHAGQVFHVSKDNFTIGRSPENDVVLFNDNQVSRQHVRVRQIESEVEIYNLSQKNELIVNSEVVRKWKILNDNLFTIGDSEIRINFDLGHSVVHVRPQLVPPPPPVSTSENVNSENQLDVKNLKTTSSQAQSKHALPKALPKQQPATRPNLPQEHIQKVSRTQPQHLPQMKMGTTASPEQMLNQQFLNQNVRPQLKNKKINQNKNMTFYIILGVVLIALYAWLSDDPPKKKKTVKDIKPTLQYDSDYLIKQNSAREKEINQKLRAQYEEKNSATALRIEENFQKGMRDFYLGQYSRSIDYFQTVLNLDSNHQLARRHLFLARARLDEVLKAKLILGEKYYQSHNFKMCEAMFEQVLVMLEGKSNDANYIKAQSMVEKCRLASEGIQ